VIPLHGRVAIRVAYISSAPFISGAERSLQTMLRYLPREQVEPVVIGPEQSRLAPWCRSHGIPFHPCPLAVRDKWHPVRWWSSMRSMREILKRERVDLVHSNQLWSYPTLGAAAADLGLPRVCHMRDEASPEAVRWCCTKGIEAVICISRHIERAVSPAWSEDDRRPLVHTLLNPVVLPEWPGMPEDSGACRGARHRFGVPEGAVVLGFIGQIVPVKGLSILLEVLAGLACGRGWHLLVAGRDPRPGAPYELECRRRVTELGLDRSVTFLGFLEDTEPFYRAIDLVIVPSMEEPLGRVPLEAASYGRPSLAHAVGGLPETILDGETGWLVPPGNLDALGQALAAFIEYPSREAGQAARRWVEQIADPARYVERIVDIYRTVREQPARIVADA
jgi:L-malate glycosyltransferase